MPPRPRAHPPPAPPTGPYLQCAALCEKVLQEGDGVLSLIRVVDRIISAPMGPDVPSEMPAMAINLTLVVMLKSGEARGTFPIGVTIEAPSGQRLGEQQLPVLMEGEDRGANLVIGMAFQAPMPGLYWFDVSLDDTTLLTRVPLRVVYQPTRIGGAQSPVDE